MVWVVANTSTGRIVSVHATEAEGDTAAAADADYSNIGDTDAIDWAGEEPVAGLGYRLADGKHYFELLADAVAGTDWLSRLTVLRSNWAAREDDFRGIWAARDGNAANLYVRWIEMNVRALAQPANITTDARYNKLLAESQIDGQFWYTHFSQTLWATYLPDDRSTWTYYSTAAPANQGSDPPNTRGGTADMAMELNTEATFDYVAALYELIGIAKPA